MTNSKQVTVIIPNFNGLNLLKHNLPAVQKCMRQGDELLIVDDASSDQSVSWLQEHYHLVSQPNQGNFSLYTGKLTEGSNQLQIQVVQTQQNLRFGAAVNLGVSQAANPLLLLLNNDVQPLLTVIDELASFFSDPAVFAVGCLEIENPETSQDVWQLGGKNRLWFDRGIFRHSRADKFTTGPTAWASGGSAMFDRSKWLELGGFDQWFYPAYWEDIDLSVRAKKRGWKVMFCQSAVVYHHHESTHAQVFTPQQLRLMSWRNGLKFTWRHANWWQKLQFLGWQPYWILQIIKA